MLERQFRTGLPDEDHTSPLDLAYFYGIAKRRAFYFLIPFVLVAGVGSLITFIWPGRYLSQGTILVSAQEIPSDLVRPTVAALASDRIKVIQQRIMTRDNLLALAKKYRLTAGWEERMSGTELVDFIRDRAQIKPAEDRQVTASDGGRKDAIAFKVGFEYEKPQIAMRVANELVTMILNEDVRSRTEFAAQTTKFLEREAKRLEADLGLINDQITKVKQANTGILIDTTKADDARALAMLRAELIVKSASYSEQHPDIRALKRKIEAFEKGAALTDGKSDTAKDAKKDAEQNPKAAAIAAETNIDTLETQRIGLRAELNNATQKLSAARLGENLQKDQHSERLEVIEQPTLPDDPIRPNKKKMYTMVMIFAAMAGGGLAFAAEVLNRSIRRSEDLFSLIDSQLIVTIPYIVTPSEVRRRKIKIIGGSAVVAALIVAAAVAVIFILPPLDVLFDQVMVRLLR